MLLGKDLHRQLLREARHLPDSHVSEHYLTRIRTAFREPPPPESSVQAVRRVKHAQKLLRQLQAANDGYLHALSRAFETAYGIRGTDKHAALAPFLGPGQPKHTFPPALAALVTSPTSHVARPPTPAQLLTPPTMPERADPSSEAARLLGTLTPERVRAVKRRWWNLQTGKVRAPLAVRVQRGGKDVTDEKEALELLDHAGLGGMREGLLRRGWDRVRQLEEKAAGGEAQRPLPPRRLQTPEQRTASHAPPTKRAAERVEDEQRRVFSPSSKHTKWHRPKQVTARLLRRRAAEVLEQAPAVVLHVPAEGDAKGKVRFEVVRSEHAKGEKGRFREANDEEQWWQGWGTVQAPSKSAKKQR
ncbi:hypothetical protein JCM10450v2_003049 [Rhodotorula kratochvilovae]